LGLSGCSALCIIVGLQNYRHPTSHEHGRNTDMDTETDTNTDTLSGIAKAELKLVWLWFLKLLCIVALLY
jgi:hypothetical protein